MTESTTDLFPSDVEFLSPPTEPEAAEEWERLSNEDKRCAKSIWAALVSEGVEPRQADRDSVAAVVQHRRLHAPRIPQAELKSLEFLAKQYQGKSGVSGEEAEQFVMKQYLAKKAAPKPQPTGRRRG